MFLLLLLGLAFSVLAAPLQKRQAPAGVPAYVLEYAPIVYLYSGETFLPGDIGGQLTHTYPESNFTRIDVSEPLTLDNLNILNTATSGGGSSVFLTSKQGYSQSPKWIHGVKPDSSGMTQAATSCAIIVVDNGNGIVDAFFMYFYNYNFGGVYFGQQTDDHIGDWEHNMVRFSNGVPQAMWYSQHSNGEAFTYAAMEKYNGVRPISYSANGTHANYAITGEHSHDIPNVNLPWGVTHDYTDKGPMWDPTLNAYYYTYNSTTQTFAAYDDSTPVNWLYFTGGWGNAALPQSNPQQKCILGISAFCQYTNGPTGPEAKDLNRTQVCPDNGDMCIVRSMLGP